MKNNEKTNTKIERLGMSCILISFIPWIIYWISCGMGNNLGIIIAFVISLIFIISQVHKKDFNLMDIASISYFGIAIIGTFIFNLNIFVEHSGFIGYLILFLMALISIIVKQPYTFQISKKDYPEIYWKHKIFLDINNVITGVWVIIFIVNAGIFLFLDVPLTIIISNILIILGIIFSIIFPLKAPAYFVSKEFKKYDWNMNLNLQRTREENGYDVIIVGSGIGGLTCGALLSKRGYKVLVLEQHTQVGGYCSSFIRKNFIFNVGVIDIGGLWKNGPITYLLKQLDLKKEDLFVKNKSIKYILNRKEIPISGELSNTIKTLSEFFPEEKENIKRFFENVKKAYEEVYSEAKILGTPLPDYLIVKIHGEKKLVNHPKEHPYFYEWYNKTFQEKLDEFFTTDELKLFLSGLSGYTGTTAKKTSAIMGLTVWMGYFIHGGYTIKGGMQNFVNVLSDFIKNKGGNVLPNHKVDKINIENNMVKEVNVGSAIFKAPIIVANANAKNVFLELIGENNLNKEFVNYISGLKMSPSVFVVYLGVNMDLSAYSVLIKNIDEEMEIAIISNSDKNLAPKGKSTVLILANAFYSDFPKRETKEYNKKKKEFAEKLIQKAEKIIPNLSKHIDVLEIATPRTMERYTSIPEGALYSFDQSIEIKRPYFKTPIRGLYLVGASTFPGGGIEGSTISGIICANDIYNWKVDTE